MTKFSAGSSWSVESLPTISQGLYVVVFIDTQQDRGVLYRIDEAKTRGPARLQRRPLNLYPVSIKDVTDAHKFGAVREVSVLRSRQRRPLAKLSEREEKTAQMMRSMVDPEMIRRLVSDDYRPAAINAIAQANRECRKHVLRVLHKLLSCALNVAAAAESGYHRCGKPANVDRAIKQGRPRMCAASEPSLAGRNVTEKDRGLLRVYFSAKSPTKATKRAYEEFKSGFALKHVQALESGHVATVTRPDEEAMSEGQFRYHLEKLLAHEALNAKVRCLSDKDYRRVFIGHARDGVQIAGQRLLIDSTVIDVYVVCAWDRTRILGRPTVYIVTCALTSAIVGLHLTLHAPSAKQAKIALFNALRPKDEYLANLGLASWCDLFPTACIPTELYADRGELLSMAGRQLGVCAAEPEAGCCCAL
jgi:hypothetical protein